MIRRALAFAIVLTMTLSVLVWTGWLAWDTADQIATRLSSERLGSLRLGDTFAADLHELRSHFRRFEATRSDRHWRMFKEAERRLIKSLENQSLNASTPSERAILNSLQVNLAEYAGISQQTHDRIKAGVGREALAPDIIALGDQAADLAADIRRLISSRQENLEQSLSTARQRLASLVVITALSLITTVLFSIFFAWLVWRGTIQPLKRRLLASEDIARQTEKLASLGVLAAGVAHEIRNPLTAIKARLFMQQRRLDPGNPALEDTRIIDQEINRMETIVRTVLTFAKPERPNVQEVQPLAILSEIRHLMSPDCETQKITMVVDCAHDLRIRADVTQLHQVFLNLARNAIEAVGKGGCITLRIRRGLRKFGGHLSPAALIEVEDDGPGIPAEARHRLFDPFYTTKPHGTGLGLAISARIVQSNGGLMEFASNPGNGTLFCVCFPCVE